MLKILIAEDDLMIADMTEEVLVDDGYNVCGIARTVDEAVALGRLHKPDLAVIDMRLADGGIGSDVAARLSAEFRLGILYATGNLRNVVKTAATGDACIAKPYRAEDLLRALEIVVGIVATGKASRPFPAGFEVLNSNTSLPESTEHG